MPPTDKHGLAYALFVALKKRDAGITDDEWESMPEADRDAFEGAIGEVIASRSADSPTNARGAALECAKIAEDPEHFFTRHEPTVRRSIAETIRAYAATLTASASSDRSTVLEEAALECQRVADIGEGPQGVTRATALWLRDNIRALKDKPASAKLPQKEFAEMMLLRWSEFTSGHMNQNEFVSLVHDLVTTLLLGEAEGTGP